MAWALASAPEIVNDVIPNTVIFVAVALAALHAVPPMVAVILPELLPLLLLLLLSLLLFESQAERASAKKRTSEYFKNDFIIGDFRLFWRGTANSW